MDWAEYERSITAVAMTTLPQGAAPLLPAMHADSVMQNTRSHLLPLQAAARSPRAHRQVFILVTRDTPGDEVASPLTATCLLILK